MTQTSNKIVKTISITLYNADASYNTKHIKMILDHLYDTYGTDIVVNNDIRTFDYKGKYIRVKLLKFTIELVLNTESANTIDLFNKSLESTKTMCVLYRLDLSCK